VVLGTLGIRGPDGAGASTREATRAHPLYWRIENFEAVARGFGINVRRSGGSHVYFTHLGFEGVSIPGPWPIKPPNVGLRAFHRTSEAGVFPEMPDRLNTGSFAEDEGDGCLVEVPDRPGCMSDSETSEEAIADGIDAMRGWLEPMRAEGRPVPAPTRFTAA
jgi:predicted RNase H-like HicB family nuclease